MASVPVSTLQGRTLMRIVISPDRRPLLTERWCGLSTPPSPRETAQQVLAEWTNRKPLHLRPTCPSSSAAISGLSEELVGAHRVSRVFCGFQQQISLIKDLLRVQELASTLKCQLWFLRVSRGVSEQWQNASWVPVVSNLPRGEAEKPVQRTHLKSIPKLGMLVGKFCRSQACYKEHTPWWRTWQEALASEVSCIKTSLWAAGASFYIQWAQDEKLPPDRCYSRH